MTDWNNRFLGLAEHVGTWSKDPRTQVGAVIVDDRNRILSLGFNGFPRGVHDVPATYEDRERKLERVVHAEANAILFSSRSTSGTKLYVSLPPCNECAKLVIQAGIIEVHHYISDRIDPVSMEMFDQAGVEVFIHRREIESIDSVREIGQSTESVPGKGT